MEKITHCLKTPINCPQNGKESPCKNPREDDDPPSVKKRPRQDKHRASEFNPGCCGENPRENDDPPCVKRPKQEKHRTSGFNPAWLYKYNWVVSTGEGMFCWVCVEHAPDNKRRYNFIGQPAKCIREDILKDHQKTETHVFCMGKEMEKQTGVREIVHLNITPVTQPALNIVNTMATSGIVLTTKDNTEELMAAVKSIIPALSYDKHKGQAGRIAVIGGSQEYTGAPYYAAITTLKVGCDLSHVFCTSGAAPVIKSYSPELIVHPYLDHANAVDEVGKWLPRLHALVVGPGLGRDQQQLDIVKNIIHKAKRMQIPLIIDADGVFLVTQEPDIIKGYAKATLTPNEMEFGRLYQSVMSRKLIPSEDNVQNVVDLSKALNNVTIVRKGVVDIIACGDQVFVCSVEGSPRRCGGQGDILAGAMGTLTYWAHTAIKSPNSDLLRTFGPTTVSAYGACALTRECNRMAFSINRRSTSTTDMIPCIQEAFEALFGMN